MACIFSWGGFERLEQQVAINQILVGRFNAMLSWGMSLPDFANVRCVDLRNTLAHGGLTRDFG